MIRPLVPLDKEQFVELMVMFFDERLKHFGLEFDRVSTETSFDLFINNNEVFGLVAEENGVLSGVIVAVRGLVLAAKGLCAQEIVWYVRPDKRGCGVRLIKAFEKLAKSKGCDSLIMVGMAGDASNEFYKRDGYIELQNIFYKAV